MSLCKVFPTLSALVPTTIVLNDNILNNYTLNNHLLLVDDENQLIKLLTLIVFVFVNNFNHFPNSSRAFLLTFA